MEKKFRVFTVMLAMVMAVASFDTFAKSDKAVEKARQAVENASPDDWQTYAKSAKLLIRKNANMAEAKQWIEKSISIRETALNLEIFGDYYVKNNMPSKAVSYYIKSIDKIRETEPTADFSDIQAKITAASKIK